MNAPFPQTHRPERENADTLLGPLPARRAIKKAVILAAGRGRRMGKLTADRPKAALEVGGHALIDWQIAALQAAGVEEIAVVTGHAAQALAGRGVTYIHNPNWATETQVETLLCARDWIGDELVIVSYSDILYHPCAPLALLERPGEIVIAYDADHRWLWKKRFGNWLKDSETFRLGPGQVLAEIGGKPTDIEAIDGQFMGLMLLTGQGLKQLAGRFCATPDELRRKLDFTKLLSGLLADDARIDTAANLLPWMEVDSAKDLKIAQRMTERDEIKGTGRQLVFPADRTASAVMEDAGDEPDATSDIEPEDPPAGEDQTPETWDETRLAPYAQIRDYRVANAFAIQNWGRSGSTFVQTLFDDHPQVLSTPNFYSRRFYIVWASRIGRLPDHQKIGGFLEVFEQWWNPGLVDATAGLHRLGPDRRDLAGVKRETLEGYLRAAFAGGRPITRRSLFEAAHLAYALSRGQALAAAGLQILYPVHGEPRAVACGLLEDFPHARFIHTLRDPVANVASSIQHLSVNALDLGSDSLEATLGGLFEGKGGRYGWPYTSFAERPYQQHLISSDRARFLKLENLHRDGAGVMAATSDWLGIVDSPQLLASTWDGKRWWNRPESGSDSRLGGLVLSRNVDCCLGPKDRRTIDRLARGMPGVAVAYDQAVQPAAPSLAAPLALLLGSLRQARCARRSELRSIRALLTLRGVLPQTFVKRLRTALRRERYRIRLLQMASGTISIRKTLPDSRKSSALQAALLISPSQGSWRTRALTAVSRKADHLQAPDRLVAAFLDEATADRRLDDLVFWILVLGPGWWLCRILTDLRVRALLARLLLRPVGAKSATMQGLGGGDRTATSFTRETAHARP